MKLSLIYIVPTNLQHKGLRHKFLGQLHAFNVLFNSKLHCFLYKNNKSVFSKLFSYIKFELVSLFYMYNYDLIYIRYDPKALITNFGACIFSNKKKVIFEHNAVFEFSLKTQHKEIERRLHLFWIKWFQHFNLIHSGVSGEIAQSLIKDGLNRDSVLAIQNGFESYDVDFFGVNHDAIASVEKLKATFSKVAVFIGNNYVWHGIEEIIDLFKDRQDCALIIVGDFSEKLTDSSSVLFLGQQSMDTMALIYPLCHFGIGGFNNRVNCRTLVSHLKVVEYLCNGLPVLVNNDESASEISELRSYIFDYHKNRTNLELIINHEFNRDVVKNKSITELSWEKRLKPVVERFTRTSLIIPMYMGLGNGVLMIPFLKRLKKDKPHFFIVLLCEESKGIQDLFLEENLIDDVIFKLNKYKYDYCLHTIVGGDKRIVINLKLKHFKTKILTQAYIDHKQSLYEKVFNFLFSNQCCFIDSQMHESKQYMAFLPYFGVIPSKNIPNNFLFVPSQKLSRVVPSSYCVIQIGAAFNTPDSKVWPLVYWKELIGYIYKYKKIILVGSQNEVSFGKQVLSGIEENNIINLIGKIEIPELLEIVSSADFVLGVDSSVGHISGSMNKNTLILWGPTHFDKSHQLGSNTHFIHLHKECSPCRGPERMGLYNGPDSIKFCKHNIYCMRDITPYMVFEKLTELSWVKEI